MNPEILKYCSQGIVRYLNGDIQKFERFRRIALNIYEIEEEKRRTIATIGDLIPEHTKQKIYEIARTRTA